MKLRYVHCPQSDCPHVFLFSIDDARAEGLQAYFQGVLAWIREELPADVWRSTNLTIQVRDASAATVLRLRWC